MMVTMLFWTTNGFGKQAREPEIQDNLHKASHWVNGGAETLSAHPAVLYERKQLLPTHIPRQWLLANLLSLGKWFRCQAYFTLVVSRIFRATSRPLKWKLTSTSWLQTHIHINWLSTTFHSCLNWPAWQIIWSLCLNDQQARPNRRHEGTQ